MDLKGLALTEGGGFGRWDGDGKVMKGLWMRKMTVRVVMVVAVIWGVEGHVWFGG